MTTPILFQRLEAASMLAAALYLYQFEHGNWLLFVALWLAFDLTMIGYTLGPKIGAYVYNLGHSYILPAALAATAIGSHSRGLAQFTLVWVAHITLDRLLGYGLKETTDFTHTHLGRIGSKQRA